MVGKGNRKDRTAWTGRESGSVAWPHAFTWTEHTEKVGVVGAWRSQKAFFSSLGGDGPSPAGPLSLGKRHGAVPVARCTFTADF